MPSIKLTNLAFSRYELTELPTANDARLSKWSRLSLTKRRQQLKEKEKNLKAEEEAEKSAQSARVTNQTRRSQSSRKGLKDNSFVLR